MDTRGGLESTALNGVVEGSAQVNAVIHRQQAHNAFGEVVQEIDGRNNVTNFKYNTLGLLTEKSDPETSVTLANGFIQRARPTTQYYYDLGGSGLNGEPAQILTEFHADGGKQNRAYDVFGDARSIPGALDQPEVLGKTGSMPLFG